MDGLTDSQRARVAALAEVGTTIRLLDVPESSVIVVKESARGFWFEVLEPEPTQLHAWDIPQGGH